MRVDVEAVGFRIETAAGPVGAADIGRQHQRAERAVRFGDNRWCEQWPDVVLRHQFFGFGAQRWCQVVQHVHAETLAIERQWPGGEGLGRTGFFIRRFRLRHCAFFNRPDRLAGFAVQHKQEGALGGLCQRLDGAAFCLHVEQHRCRRQIVVPQAVMNGLVVPAVGAGLHVHCHQGLAIEAVTRAVETVVVGRGHFHRQIHQAEFGIGAHLCPHTGVAVLLGGAVLPTAVARFIGERNGVEDPQAFAGANVETAHITACVPG